MEYKIVSHTDTQTVEDRVNYWLLEGWELYGEIKIGKNYVFQTMIKVTPENKSKGD